MAMPLAAAMFLSGAVALSSHGAGAASSGDLRQQAAALMSEISTANAQIGAAENAYNAAVARRDQLLSSIATIRSQIHSAQSRVTANQSILREAAINSYINDGTNSGTNVFVSDQKVAVTTHFYAQMAAGDLTGAVANLTNAEDALGVQQRALSNAEQQASQQVAIANSAIGQASATKAQLNRDLSNVRGQLAAELAREQAAAAAAAAAQSRAQLLAAQQAAQSQAASAASNGGGGTGPVSIPVPPSSGIGGAAVAAAESYLGVPYVWGGASRGGVDCSGLTMLAYAAVGVSLPHYSGGQMAASTPVPVGSLEPGDLLFYGPGGSEHVAMYIGGGMMIEAPYTGAVVHITPVRLGYGFVGAGRP
jgi:peptidoglycan DL-endopeptidase CwlO